MNAEAEIYLSNALFVIKLYSDGSLRALQKIIAEDKQQSGTQADIENRRIVDVMGDTVSYA